MKILVTSPYVSWPANFGGAVRTLNIVRALGNLGHQVILLTASSTDTHNNTDANVDWRNYPSPGVLSHFYNPQFSRVYRNALSENPDLVLAEFPYQARMIVGPARTAGVPIVYDAHNVEVDRFRKMGKPVISAIVRLMESYLCRNARSILVTSDCDKSLLRQHYRVSGTVLPNGVDTNRFTIQAPDSDLLRQLGLNEKKVALFFGTLSYGPNSEALEFLLKEVWPRVMAKIPDARLLVVGRSAPEWAKDNDGVVVTGAVEDIVAHIRLANVVLAPIFRGGGTRLKIIEALACGQTVLSTPFGAEGLVIDSNDALILAEKEFFTEKLISCLLEENLPGANNLSRQMAMSYDWDKLVSNIDWEAFAQRSS